MKSIQEYLDLMREKIKTHNHDTKYNNEYDYIDLNILLECQYKFNDEYFNPGYSIYGNIFESHGIFDRARQFSSFITLFIKTFVSEKNKTIMFICNDIDELKNDFFEIIYINFSDLSKIGIKGEYDETNQENRFINNKFTYITISLDNNINNEDIYKTISHELKHAYQDLNLCINNKENLYQKAIQTKIYKLNFEKTDDDIMNLLKYVLHITDKYEISAYISELDGILGDKKYDNIQNAFNEIYKSDIYSKMKYVKLIIDINDAKTLNKFCIAYNKIFDTKFSNDKIKNILYKKVNLFWEKFTNQVYQCVCDHTKYGKRSFGDINQKNETINNMKKYINNSIFIE